LKLVLAGLPFEVQPEGFLSTAERHALSGLGRVAGEPLAEPADAWRPFVLDLDGEESRASDAALDEAPATVGWVRDRVTVSHRRLDADLDPFAGRGRLSRDPALGWPLEVTLRVALAARLPLEGGLPLHAAGLVLRGQGVAFFGPSGAGKSTLVAVSPHPVLSDEMVAIVPAGSGTAARGGPFVLAGTGFWGTHGATVTPAGPFPLAALVELGRGPRLRIERLDPQTAVRRLIAAVLVPPGPPLWSAALGVIGRLVGVVPMLRLAWSPTESPWDELERAIHDPRAPR
jgi:hypothetical protein